jgi:hypothetical protein
MPELSARVRHLSDSVKAAIILRRVVSHRQADWTAIATVIPVLEGRPLAAFQREDFNHEAVSSAEILGEETLVICGYLPRPSSPQDRKTS